MRYGVPMPDIHLTCSVKDLDKAYKEAMSVGTGYWRVAQEQSLAPPVEDHRWDHILKEFGARQVQPIRRTNPDFRLVRPADDHALWLPPAGAFPQETETVITFPDVFLVLGRWRCSVVCRVDVVRTAADPPDAEGLYWYTTPMSHRYWVQAEPIPAYHHLPTYDRWRDIAGDATQPGKVWFDVFKRWVEAIENNPECCVKHKMIGRYDDTDCVGVRSQAPPRALAPAGEGEARTGYQLLADNVFASSPVTNRLYKVFK